ncbi:MAG: spore cortex biosynthesis protein YabQ [Eubacteriales bacterium]
MCFLGALSLGVIFGLIYDVFRILRISRLPYIAPSGKFYDKIKIPEKPKENKKSLFTDILHFSDTAITITEDIVFWLIITVCEILFIYHVNGGEIRIYFFLCTLFGAAVYFFTAGKIVMYFSVRIIFLTRCLLYWMIYIIIYPIRKVFLAFKRALIFINRKFFLPVKTKLTERMERRYSDIRCKEILENAENGFLILKNSNDNKRERKKEKKHTVKTRHRGSNIVFDNNNSNSSISIKRSS